MNRLYRIIWSVATQAWVVVSELAKAGGRKTREKAGRGAALLPPVIALACCGQAHAQAFSWSPSGANSGGSGNWDLTSSSWYNGVTLAPWTNAAGRNATFGGAAGTVNLLTPVTVQNLNFSVGGYTLTGGTINNGASAATVGRTISVGSGNTATINPVIAGTGNPLIVNGGGTVVLGGVNTYANTTNGNFFTASTYRSTNVTQGSTLRVASDSNLGAAPTASANGLQLGDATSRGTLAITGAGFTTNRNVLLGPGTGGGGGIDVAAGVTATFSGLITSASAGDGASLTASGPGTLVVTANNNYQGATTISAGTTVQVGNGGATGQLGSGANAAIVDNGTLVYNRTGAVVRFGPISGAGSLRLTNAGFALALSGANTYTGGTFIDAGTLRIGNGGPGTTFAGDIFINNTSSAVLFNTGTNSNISIAGAISGPGSVQQIANNRVTLSGASTYSGGSTITNGSIVLTNASSAGTGRVTITRPAGTTGLELAFTSAGTFGNVLAGAGATTVSGAQATITGASAAYTGQWNVTATGTLAVSNTATTSTANLGTGGVNVAGTVNVQTTGAFSFANALTGAGTLNASSGNQAFSFGPGAGGSFAGTLRLTNNTFALSGTNTTAVTGAALEVGTGNVTRVGDGNQAIRGLNINGGTVQFNVTAPDQASAASLITAGSLDVSHAGAVGINLPMPYVASPPDTNNALNLLMQDDANVGVRLVSAGTVTGSAGALVPVDQNGNAITAGRQIDISQNGNTVAKGSYDYRLTTGAAADGLYLNYGLKQLELQAGQTLVLAQDSGATGTAADMSARITGTGSLAIDAGTGSLSLSNSGNDYSGQTSVSSGTLRADSDQALGQTSALNLAGTTGFDLNGKTQTVGSLNGAAGSTLDLHGGTLGVGNGGTSAGTLTGAGQLNLGGGTLGVQGANTGLSASTAIASGATISLNNVGGLGSGTIMDNGALVLNGATGTLGNAIAGTGAVNLTTGADVTATGSNTLSGNWNTAAGTRLSVSSASNLGTAAISNAGTLNVDTTTDWTLANAIGGAGEFVKGGAGRLSLTGQTGWTGATRLEGGELVLDGVVGGAQLASNITGTSGTRLSLQNGAVLTGWIDPTAVSIDATSTWNMTASSQVDSVNLVGAINFAAPAALPLSAGRTLTASNWVGQGGTIGLYTVLAGDGSPSDRLVIDGGPATGSAKLHITNAGGAGAFTTGNGILVVDAVNGGTTAPTAFTLDGRAVAGAYEYRLFRGSSPDPADDNWYLRSEQPLPPSGSSGSTQPQPPSQPQPQPQALFRPEVAAYLANQNLAGQMFVHSLHDRLGESQYVEGQGFDPEQDKPRSAWVRVVGNWEGSHSQDGNFQIDSNTFQLQGGAELAKWKFATDADRIHVGLMGTYGYSSSNAEAAGNPARAHGTVEGFSLGAYGTWYQNDRNKLGAYVDTWFQYGWFSNRVEGNELPTVNYNAQGWAISGEGGYAIPLPHDWVIEPQGQIIYVSYNEGDISEPNGTRVTGADSNGLITRLGVRFQRMFQHDDGRKIQPYATVNWWHTTANSSISFNQVAVGSLYPSNRFELKLGLNVDLGKRWTGWANVSGEWGAQSYYQFAARGGVKYTW
ncbi:autotransporter outer membrane beta-barrel domain-containing protein [Paraburkholderia sp. BL10I2N1]|uniref:autotransporter outer membrane beta-barrel domain-containing protein n=1 Tax=Paraburkholderia sp. BL10I2N1 TaxID=1938796 RepID=UPI001061EEAB|nr:autotransporter outer membrane beta-barrel domain-containing protein [Paraburkholderia sp. BL10I2N1]TDN57861.1 autotransporter family porin [Paraburkholderia sp. BL10I2N1]